MESLYRQLAERVDDKYIKSLYLSMAETVENHTKVIEVDETETEELTLRLSEATQQFKDRQITEDELDLAIKAQAEGLHKYILQKYKGY